jgi:enamine deaminase RidA (YjgF/YER057c/UK114 family)
MEKTETLVELVNPEPLMPPKGFAHAAVAYSNRMLYLAGQVAADRTGVVQHWDDLVGQFDLTLQNIRTCVQAAGGRMTDIVKLNYYVLDVRDYLAKRKELGTVYRSYFGNHFPAMTLVEVRALYNDGALIEIDGVAALSPVDASLATASVVSGGTR